MKELETETQSTKTPAKSGKDVYASIVEGDSPAATDKESITKKKGKK